MNAAANPQIEIAGLKAWIYSHSNASVKADVNCHLIDATLGGNKVLVEYEYDPGEKGSANEPTTQPQVTLMCYWHAGCAFDIADVPPRVKHIWTDAAFADADERAQRSKRLDEERQAEELAEAA